MSAPDEPEPAVAPSPEPAAQAEPAAPAAPVVVLAPASTGRAGCKACGNKIAKGELRVGEKLHNEYVDADTMYWFHARCAAFRRPEAYLQAVKEAQGVDLSALDAAWVELAQAGVQQHRLPRITRAELAPSGRARCRSCKEAIAKDSFRFSLSIFHDGRFDPMGYVHLACDEVYFGVRVNAERVRYAAVDLKAEQLTAFEQALETTQRTPRAAAESS